MKTGIIALGLIASCSGHGLIRSIQGANGVEMPGLSVQDGTPRDCSSNGCGSQADTAIIRDREIASGKASPLGRTQGQGPVDAGTVISAFMGAGNGSAAASTNSSAGASPAQIAADTQLDPDQKKRRALFGGKGKLGNLAGLLGGAGAGAGATGAASNEAIPATENIVNQLAGDGATQGLPTCSDSGAVTMTFYQINGDGAGPLTAEIDPTSGGNDANAFQAAQVTQNIPGVFSLSGNKMTPMTMEVQMPQGMTCNASVGGANNVCIVRVRNNAIAGPFGGAAAFTQSPAAKKRAVEYRIKKRMASKFRA